MITTMINDYDDDNNKRNYNDYKANCNDGTIMSLTLPFITIYL